MKHLPLPTQNDIEALRGLAEKKRLGSYPHLSNRLHEILARYVTYRLLAGNPWIVSPLRIHNPLKKSLITHYNSPPQGLEHLEHIRDKGSPDVCPMCGSLKTGTLDHVLPKTEYPEFAVFTQNLVPACDCNIARGAEYKGIKSDQRVLHPYYDLCLRQRLLRANFEGNLERPKISLTLCCGDIPEMEAIKFHLDTILLKTRVLEFMDAKWSTMIRTPASILMNVENGPVDQHAVIDETNRMLLFYDVQHGTPNNWLSFFYAGIVHSSGVTLWLANRITGINNGTIVPT